MSKLRNTLDRLRRDRNTVAAAALAASLATVGLAACSADGRDPVSPAAAPSAHKANTQILSTSATAASPAALATTYEPGTGDAPYDADDAPKQLSPSQFASLASTWRTQPSDRQAGTRKPQSISCGFVTQGSVSMTLAPSATPRQFRIGRTTVTVPGGAVPSTVTITATASYSPNGATVSLLPHGYQFAKPLQIDLDYKGCARRFGSPLNFYYLNDTGGVIQTMPSNDDSTNGVLHALTDHFSGFMVAWS